MSGEEKTTTKNKINSNKDLLPLEKPHISLLRARQRVIIKNKLVSRTSTEWPGANKEFEMLHEQSRHEHALNKMYLHTYAHAQVSCHR